ncbi:basic secretory family protein [Pedobacter riviphilus]|nr:basic secretory family protein [Pedobacter riviphilus]
MEKSVKPGIIKTVDASLRDHTYTKDIWVKLTGKDLDALWADYVKNSEV